MTARTSAFPDLEQAPPQSTLGEALMVGSLVVAVAALASLGWLANEVFEGETASFDAWARASVHAFASPGLTTFMTWVSFLGFQFLYGAVPVALIAFVVGKWKRAAAWLAVTMAGALLLDLTLKLAFHRARPVPWYGPAPPSYSFPSGHALVSFCFYGVLVGLITARIRSVFLRILCWSAAAALVALIGLSRIYLGVHYASDVVAGYLTAAMWVGIMLAMDRWRLVRRRNKLTLQRAGSEE